MYLAYFQFEDTNKFSELLLFRA